MNLDDHTVNAAIEHLRDRNIVYVFYGSTSRVPKYKHMLPSVYELEPAEVAVISVMLLRGPQTLGELRTRTERLHGFAGLGEIQETLDGLIRRDDPLVVKLPVLAGQKEARFGHLISGEIDVEAFATAVATGRSSGGASNERFEKLEEEIKTLREEIDVLKATLEEFRRQFE